MRSRTTVCWFVARCVPGAWVILLVLATAPRGGSPIEVYVQRRSIRLALAVTRLHGWQPREFGGDGSIEIQRDAPYVVDAIRFGSVPDSEAVTRFFAAGAG